MSAQGPDEALPDDTDSDSTEFHECREVGFEPEAQRAVAASAVGSEGKMPHASEQQAADDMIETQLDPQHAQLVNCEKFEGQKLCDPEPQPGAAAVLDASVEAAGIATPTPDAAVQDGKYVV